MCSSCSSCVFLVFCCIFVSMHLLYSCIMYVVFLCTFCICCLFLCILCYVQFVFCMFCILGILFTVAFLGGISFLAMQAQSKHRRTPGRRQKRAPPSYPPFRGVRSWKQLGEYMIADTTEHYNMQEIRIQKNHKIQKIRKMQIKNTQIQKCKKNKNAISTNAKI